MLSLLTIFLDKRQTKSLEGNENSTQSNSQVQYHQPALKAKANAEVNTPLYLVYSIILEGS